MAMYSFCKLYNIARFRSSATSPSWEFLADDRTCPPAALCGMSVSNYVMAKNRKYDHKIWQKLTCSFTAYCYDLNHSKASTLACRALMILHRIVCSLHASLVWPRIYWWIINFQFQRSTQVLVTTREINYLTGTAQMYSTHHRLR